MSADNPLPADQLAALAPGDTVTIESGAEKSQSAPLHDRHCPRPGAQFFRIG